MVFVESAVFTRQVQELLSDHEYAGLQTHLLLIYRKGVKDDLSAAEKKIPRTLNANW